MANPLGQCHEERRCASYSFGEEEHFFRSQLLNSEVSKTEYDLVVHLPEGNKDLLKTVTLFSGVTTSECTHKYTKCTFPLPLVDEIIRMRDIFYHIMPLGLEMIGIIHKAGRDKLSYGSEYYDNYLKISEILIANFQFRPNSPDYELDLTKIILEKYKIISHIQNDEISKRVVHHVSEHLKSRNAN